MAEPKTLGPISPVGAVATLVALLSRERILKYYSVDIPLRIRAEDLLLTARVIGARLVRDLGLDTL